MKLLVATLMICFTSFSAMASNSFECKGEKSERTLVKGYYLGEETDAISLETNQVYNIFSSKGDATLNLMRDNVGLRTRMYENLPLQFVARQRDDLGRSTTRFAIPLGVFGGSVGKKFQAILRVNIDGTETYPLSCELVSNFK
jgi:hypothetical protein